MLSTRPDERVTTELGKGPSASDPRWATLPLPSASQPSCMALGSCCSLEAAMEICLRSASQRYALSSLPRASSYTLPSLSTTLSLWAFWTCLLLLNPLKEPGLPDSTLISDSPTMEASHPEME